MKLQHRFTVGAAHGRVWSTFKDLPAVAACVPGVDELTALGDNRYHGRFSISVGPIRLALFGELEMAILDEAGGLAQVRASGTDRRLGGSVRALVTLSVVADDAGGSMVMIDSDVQVLGRLGELGQPIMKRKADEVMAVFAHRLEVLVS